MNRKLTWQVLLFAWLVGVTAGVSVSVFMFHQDWLQGFIPTAIVATIVLASFKLAQSNRVRKES